MTPTDALTQGCEDPDVARRRAAKLIADAFAGRESYWTYRAWKLLVELLATAAVAGGGADSIRTDLFHAPEGTRVEICVRGTVLEALAHYSAFRKPGAPG